jgi:hypothetical protein
MNCGRDPIGSLPFFAYLYIFDASFFVRPALVGVNAYKWHPYTIGTEGQMLFPPPHGHSKRGTYASSFTANAT